MISQQVIRDTVQRIVAVAQSPKRVLVFGSYARGDANDDSDLDLMVVEAAIDDRTREYVRLREAAGGIGVGVDLLLFTEQEFEQRRQWWTTPAYWADREGKVLYESV
jgi:predicted nucleotidyltransferase